MADSSLPMKTLGELLSVVEAGSRPLGGASSGSFGVPSLGAENIRLDGTLDLRSVRYIPKDFFYSLRTGRLKPFDILINTIGAQIGKVGRYMGEYAEAAINGNLALLRCVDNILPGYLFYYLQSEDAQHDIRTFVMGSAQPYLSPDFFVEMNIPFPSMKEQQQIAKMFDDIDEVIRSTELTITKYEDVRAGLTYDLLSRLVGGAGGRPVRDLIYSEFAGEWGEAKERNGLYGCMVLRATNLIIDGIDYETVARRFISKPKVMDKKLRKGDLILEAAGGGPGVPVGRVARFDPPDDQVYIVSNFFRTLRPAANVDKGFLYYTLDYLWRQPKIWQVQQQTTGIINLKVADYLDIRIIVPPFEEQRQIARILDDISDTIQANRRQLEKLRQLRAGFADDLFSGKVRTVKA